MTPRLTEREQALSSEREDTGPYYRRERSLTGQSVKLAEKEDGKPRAVIGLAGCANLFPSVAPPVGTRAPLSPYPGSLRLA